MRKVPRDKVAAFEKRIRSYGVVPTRVTSYKSRAEMETNSCRINLIGIKKELRDKLKDVYGLQDYRKVRLYEEDIYCYFFDDVPIVFFRQHVLTENIDSFLTQRSNKRVYCNNFYYFEMSLFLLDQSLLWDLLDITDSQDNSEGSLPVTGGKVIEDLFYKHHSKKGAVFSHISGCSGKMR